VLTACGSSGSSGTAASDSNARDTARLKLQQCLRDNGVNIPAPGQGQGGAGRVLGNAADRQKVQKAMQGPCKKYQSAAFGNITPQQRQEFQDAFVKFSACMRQNGVNIPTPNFNGGGAGGGAGGGTQRRGGGLGGINRNDPKVKAALQKCQSSLPNGGRFGGPGGGGPGGPPPA
jgi:hypothetical protein